MDAAGSDRAAVCGYSEGAAMAALFSATFPERVSRLVLAAAAVAPSEVQPLWSPKTREKIAEGWGQGALVDVFLPNHADDPRARAMWARSQRLSATRGMALKYWDLMGGINVLDILPAITVPTLVVGREGDVPVPISTQRTIAEAIAGARLAELPGNDHLLWLGDWESVADAIEEFVIGEQHRREPDVSFRRCCSPTSSARRSAPASWATAAGASCSPSTTGLPGSSSSAMKDGS